MCSFSVKLLFEVFVIKKNILFCFRYVFHYILQMSFIRLTALIGLSYREVINLYTLYHKNIFPTEILCQNIFLTKISESEFFFIFYKSNDNDTLFNQL